MILDQLTLHNFGVYRGRQVMNLTPPNREKPVVLIGGLNGGGKTTFLDAIHLVLYGKRAHCSNRGRLGYEDFLRRTIHTGVAPTEGAALELRFRHRVDGEEHSFRVHRSWYPTNSGVVETVEVLRDGALDQVLTETWNEVVEEFIPLRLSQLFLFDGEKIEQFADLENSAELMRTAIHSLLGLDLVDQLSNDLVVLERRKRTELKSEKEQAAIAELRQEVTKLQSRIDGLAIARGTINSEREQWQKKLEKIEEQFRLAGGEIFEQRGKLEGELKATQKTIDRAEDHLREVAAGAAPLLLVRDLLEAVNAQATREQQADEAQVLSRVLAERDAQTLEEALRQDAPKKVLKALAAHLEQDRSARAQAANIEFYLNLERDAHHRLQSLLGHELDEIRSSLRTDLEKLELLRAQILDVERKLAAVPDHDAIVQLIEDRKTARLNVQKSITQAEFLDREIETLQREREAKTAQVVSLIEKQVDTDFEREDSTRIIEHSARVRSTLVLFRERVIERHVRHISHLVLDSFRQLLRKETLISSLSIDPETFQLELRGKDGQTLAPDRLSAGERQLLATSLLWGMARASGRPMPTVIDTPLGRLDSVHRKHLIERYFPSASHQVLLLSTDKEIDASYYEDLKPYIAHQYRLDHNDQLGATQIQAGYFFEGV